MSCNSCGSPTHATNKCYEARLTLAFDANYKTLIGSLDGMYIKPLSLKPMVQANETNTVLKFDPVKRVLIFENERARNGKGPADQVTSKEIISGADLSELGSVQPLAESALASVAAIDDQLQLQFIIPTTVESGEVSSGFLTFVPNPNDGKSFYRLVRPDLSGDVDTLLVGHPDGSIEFVVPITSPVLVPISNLTSNGAFSGTPGVSSGTWRYQQLGQSQVITNDSGSRVEVELFFRASLQTAGTRSGVYATLVNGGSDYQTVFAEGETTLKQEGYPGVQGRFKCILEPNQRCQFRFGAWTNASGSMVATVGSVDESAGVTIQKVQQPVISVKRLI